MSRFSAFNPLPSKFNRMEVIQLWVTMFWNKTDDKLNMHIILFTQCYSPLQVLQKLFCALSWLSFKARRIILLKTASKFTF